MRAVKVRGSYETLDEARNRAQQLSKLDKYFNVYVSEVGCWAPWSPYPETIANCEYSDQQLNTLMTKYKDNQDAKDKFFLERKAKMVEESVALSTQAKFVTAEEVAEATEATVEEVVEIDVKPSQVMEALLDS
jgi:hypothetical protein